ncbi:hypothetical protein V8Z80_13400 [Orrella sp. JC864]|uniref:hypothetical protein n=1 Tax=Orrella sp. JC864 TaxID=3120298 RepID=UPI00300BC69D
MPHIRSASAARRLVRAGALLALAGAPGLAALAQTGQPLPPGPTGTPMTVHGNIEGPSRLAIVQVCEPAGNCQLSFVDTLKQDDIAELVRSYRGQGRPGTDPSVTVLALCAGNWVAAVQARAEPQPAQGMVCGYPTELDALRQAFAACDQQLGRPCAAEPQTQVSWGKWDGRHLPGRDQAPGKLYTVWDQDGAKVCTLQAGQPVSCNAQAADVLRRAGLVR